VAFFSSSSSSSVTSHVLDMNLVVVALAFLVVIPAGNLLHLLE
jgi:hypothetical protein